MLGLSLSVNTPRATAGSLDITPPPVMMETFFLLAEDGNILTDEAGNRLRLE